MTLLLATLELDGAKVRGILSADGHETSEDGHYVVEKNFVKLARYGDAAVLGAAGLASGCKKNVAAFEKRGFPGVMEIIDTDFLVIQPALFKEPAWMSVWHSHHKRDYGQFRIYFPLSVFSSAGFEWETGGIYGVGGTGEEMRKLRACFGVREQEVLSEIPPVPNALELHEYFFRHLVDYVGIGPEYMRYELSEASWKGPIFLG
ncbi:MAG: hypothetical protein V1820_05965 [archaeon]